MSSCVCKWPRKLWCKCAHAWLFMYAEICQSCATAEPQWDPGQEPWGTAVWQAVLALGWPLPPPGCPHTLTSLAWQQQTNKLRAPQSSHRSMGMFFTAPTPLFMVIMVCVLYTNTPTCQMKSTEAGVHLEAWRNMHKLACTLHQFGCPFIHANDEYNGNRFRGGLGQKCMKIVRPFGCICVPSQFLRKKSQKAI